MTNKYSFGQEGGMGPLVCIDPELDMLAEKVVDAAYKLHKKMGPGLLENVYEVFFLHELKLRSLKVERQVAIPLKYEDAILDGGLRLDLLVEDRLIVELKSVDFLLPLHRVQLMTYLKLSGRSLGLLINFNVPLIKYGIKRVVVSN